MAIPTYYIEDLCPADVDVLIEKGVVFDVRSKTSLLPTAEGDPERESFWGSRVELSDDIRKALEQ